MLLLKRVIFFVLALIVLLIGLFSYALSTTPRPEEIQYGVSFNVMYARELGLDWKQVYTAILDDLGVRHLRLAAHWPMVEPEKGVWNFEELDTELRMARERNVDVVLAVGRRLPRWPECHVPEWANGMGWEVQKEEIRTYLRAVVERYKGDPTIAYWQVENEPFLAVYAREQCGSLDTAFLDEEIALVHELDPSRPILVTDSGNLGLWYGAYKRGDSFGTSVYLHLWNEATGPVTSILPPEAYILKRSLMGLMFGKKESMLIELSAEPWLNAPIASTSLELQLERMNVDMFDDIITYATRTRFEKQYLWGAEWWYWLSLHGKPEMWERAKMLYSDG